MYRQTYIASNGVQSSCNIYIMSAGDVRYIGFEDINEGMTVTNASEQLATIIIETYAWEPNNCLFFEWYSDQKDGTVDEITYIWDKENKIASDPKWKVFCSVEENPFKNE